MSYQCVTHQRSIRFLIKSDPIFTEKEEDMRGSGLFCFSKTTLFWFCCVCVCVFFSRRHHFPGCDM